MSEQLRQEFDAVVDRACRVLRADAELRLKSPIIREATDGMRKCLAFGLTLSEGLELARRALHRLRENCPDDNDFRRAAGWLTYFVYAVCFDRLAQGQPKEAPSAVAMARACLPLLALTRDDHEKERDITTAVRKLAPYIVLLPNPSDTPSDITKFRDLLRSYDNDVRILLDAHYQRLTRKLLETLDTPTDVEIEDEMEDYIWGVLSRVRADASLPRELFVDLSETDKLAMSEMQPLWRLFFLHLAFLPQDQQSQLIRESANRMESLEPYRLNDAFYTALRSLGLLHRNGFIGEPVYQRLEAMFRHRMLPVMGKFVGESFHADSPIMRILEKEYGISPYRALGLFAWDKILSGNPPPYIHQAQQLLHESFMTALCAGGVDKSPFD
jgi:hypothetical protein